MAEDLPPIPNPEMVFGFVAPIGADVDGPITIFRRYFESRGYRVELIKVTKVFSTLTRFIKPHKHLKFSPLYNRYKSHISYGNQLREFFDDNAFLAKTALLRILMRRNKRQFITDAERYQKTIYVIQQFKRREEIDLLRHVYGRLFFQVSIYSRRSARIDYLARRFAHSTDSSDIDACRTMAEDVVQQDTNEIGSQYGQSVGKTFHDADFIINADIPNPPVNEQIRRFCELLFGSNSISPNKFEYGMLAARAAALRSLDLSRQVGAAIFSKDGEIIALGSNEVPKAGGGTYWSDEDIDDREFRRERDSNDQRKKELLSEIVRILKPRAKMELILKDQRIQDSQFMDALEYGRIVHAEMSAITDAARLGRSTKDAILFATTFPCHMCAKHIVASGISKVVFLEPYPKSLAFDLHSDSITVEGTDRGKFEHFPSVLFEHFCGIPPRRYRDMFPRGKRKTENGEFAPYLHEPPQPIIDVRLPIYTRLETVVAQSLAKSLREKIGQDESVLDDGD